MTKQVVEYLSPWPVAAANAATGCPGGACTASLMAAALALCSCGLPATGAAADPPTNVSVDRSPAADAITSITLERNCFGCPSSSVLVLQRDGTAVFTMGGNARQGTPSAVSRGAVRREDFDALARLAVRSGFFALADAYADPAVQDGAWATTSIARGGPATVPKRVFRREDAAPPALRAVETAIEDLQARIVFKPERP